MRKIKWSSQLLSSLLVIGRSFIRYLDAAEPVRPTPLFMRRSVMAVGVIAGIFIGCNRSSTDSSQVLLKEEVSSVEQDSSDKEKINASSTGESLSKCPQEAANVIRAEVIVVDENDQKIKIKDVATGNHITTRVADASTLGSFVPGDRVRVTFTSSDTMTATSVMAEETVKE